MTSRSFQRRQLSRSKVELYTECPRCFRRDVTQGIGRPSGPPFTLNNAVDALLKAEFDGYRKAGKPHPLFADAGIEAVPFAHPELDRWRHNFTGLRWRDEETGWTLYGAIDDLWQAKGGELIVADYKATARAEPPSERTLYPSYRRQMEVYQFLVRRQGFEVSDRAWFVYANGDAKAGNFGGRLQFAILMIPYVGDDGWVLDAFRGAVRTATTDATPAPGAKCEYCAWLSAAAAADG